MGQDDRQWFQNDDFADDDGSEADADSPSGRFNGEEIEFESYMFDPGERAALPQFGVTDASAAPAAVQTATAIPPIPEVTPVAAADAQPQEPAGFSAAQPPQPELRPHQLIRTSGPLFEGYLSSVEPAMDSGPLRSSGPLVDGRTSISGPPQSARASGPLSERPGATGPLGNAASVPAEPAPPAASLSSTGPLQSRFAGTGPLRPVGTGTGPLDGSQPSQSQVAEPEVQTAPVAEVPEQGVGAPPTSPSLAPQTYTTGPLSGRVLAQSDPPPVALSAPTPLTPSAPAASPISTGSLSAWTDSSLAMIEDFSSVLLALDARRRLATSGFLNTSFLTDQILSTSPRLTQQTSTGLREHTVAVATVVAERPTAPSLENAREAAVEAPAAAGNEDFQYEPFAFDRASMQSVPELPDLGEFMQASDATAGANAEADAAPLPPADFEWRAGQSEQAVEENPQPVIADQQPGEAVYAAQMEQAEAAAPVEELPAPVQMEQEWAQAPVEPAPVAEAPAPVQDTGAQPHQNSVQPGPLPFWLRSTGELDPSAVANFMPALNSTPHLADATRFPSTPSGALEEHVVEQTAQPTALDQQSIEPSFELPAIEAAAPVEVDTPPEPTEEPNYYDLPPIEPFDFTALAQPVEEEEELGFNTDELSGYSVEHDTSQTSATTDLQAVASLLNGEHPLTSDQTYPVAEEPPAANAEQSSTQAHEEAQGSEAGPTVEEPRRHGRHGWTGFVTTNLGAEAQPGMLPPDVSLPDSGESDLDITPFDFTELELESDEIATGFIDTVRLHTSGPLSTGKIHTSGPLEGRKQHNSGPLGSSPDEAPQQEEWSSPMWGSDSPPSAQHPQAQITARIWPTSWLTDDTSEDSKAQGPRLPQTAPMMDIIRDPLHPVQLIGTAPFKQVQQPVPASQEHTPEPEPGEPQESMLETASLSEEQLPADAEPAEPSWVASSNMVSPFAPDEEPEMEHEEVAPPFAHGYETASIGDLPPLPEMSWQDQPQTQTTEQGMQTYEPEFEAPVLSMAAAPVDVMEQPAYVPERTPSGKAMLGPVEPVLEVEVPHEETNPPAEPVKARVAGAEWQPQPKTGRSTKKGSKAPVVPPTAVDHELVGMPAVQQSKRKSTRSSSRKESPALPPQSTQSRQRSLHTALLSSGPLPDLAGFEQLSDWATRNPGDLGANMALAAAYEQVGDMDTALRVYRRVLRKPAVPEAILRLIAEELADAAPDLEGHPHYHQVRGDLYMKQGRFQEAISEYNRIS